MSDLPSSWPSCRLCITVEATFLRRSLGHGFKGLELGSLSSCIPCFLPNVDGGCQELLWQPLWGTTAKSFRASERCLAVLRGLELQHNCNIIATRTATQPRNAVIYRVNLPCSMFKGFEPLRKRPCLGKVKNADCVVKNSVAWLCCSSCCSYVAVVLQ